MFKHRVHGCWLELKGRIKRGWGEVTRNRRCHREGEYERLIGLMLQMTGISRDQAEKRLGGQDLESARIKT